MFLSLFGQGFGYILQPSDKSTLIKILDTFLQENEPNPLEKVNDSKSH